MVSDLITLHLDISSFGMATLPINEKSRSFPDIFALTSKAVISLQYASPLPHPGLEKITTNQSWSFSVKKLIFSVYFMNSLGSYVKNLNLPIVKSGLAPNCASYNFFPNCCWHFLSPMWEKCLISYSSSKSIRISCCQAFPVLQYQNTCRKYKPALCSQAYPYTEQQQRHG